jgi:hypothetical protein
MNSIDKVLAIDPIADTEKMLGKDHWSQFNESDNMMALGYAMLVNQMKENILKAASDTFFSMTWDEFNDIVTSNGFKNVYEYSFIHDYWKDSITTEKAAIYYRDGLVIFLTSYNNGTTVNGGNLYGELKLNNPDAGWRDIPNGCSGGFDDEGNLHFSYDIREGLINFINSLSKVGSFNSVWKYKGHFLWFVDYKEEKEPNYNYATITKEKISKLPEEVQRMLQVYVNREFKLR